MRSLSMIAWYTLDAKKKKTTKKVKGDDDKGITLVGARTLAKTMRALVKQGLDLN